jgi:cupin superfamily acireductone dioxygenase involved in methionine salvage
MSPSKTEKDEKTKNYISQHFHHTYTADYIVRGSHGDQYQPQSAECQ